MTKKIMISIAGLVFALNSLSYSQKAPMEALNRYNIIMVHGAADASSGVDCNSAEILDAWTTYDNYINDPTNKASWQVGGSPGMLGSYEKRSGITSWIDSAVFEDHNAKGSDYVYLQRSFMNPAAAPSTNGKELSLQCLGRWRRVFKWMFLLPNGGTLYPKVSSQFPDKEEK